MNNEQKVIKMILPGRCPHCDKDILMSQRFVTPIIDWVLRPEDVETAKAKVKKEVEVAKFEDETERQGILAWLNREDTLFGPEEVQPILDQIINQNNDKSAGNKTEELPKS